MFNLENYLSGLNAELTFLYVLLLVSLVLCAVSVMSWVATTTLNLTVFRKQVSKLKAEIKLQKQYDKKLNKLHKTINVNPFVTVVNAFSNALRNVKVNGIAFTSPVQPERISITDIKLSNVLPKWGVMLESNFKFGQTIKASSEVDIEDQKVEFAKIAAETKREAKKLGLSPETAQKELLSKTSHIKKTIEKKEKMSKSLRQSVYVSSDMAAQTHETSIEISFRNEFFKNSVAKGTFYYDAKVVKSAHGKSGRKQARKAIQQMKAKQSSSETVQQQPKAEPAPQPEKQEATAVGQPEPTQPSNIVHIDLDALEHEEQAAFQQQWEEEPQYG